MAEDGEPVAWRRLTLARGYGEALFPLIRLVMAEAGWRWPEIDLIAVAHGPGSFTGIRVACAAARGLALAAGLQVVAVGCLEALARAARRQGVKGALLATLDARRGQVYAQPFAEDDGPLGPPRALAPGEALQGLARPFVLVGSGAGLVLAHLPGAVAHGEIAFDARDVARAAALRIVRGERPIAGHDLHPLYLRAPDARPGRPLLEAAGALP